MAHQAEHHERPRSVVLAVAFVWSLLVAGCLCVGQGTLVGVPDGVRAVETLGVGAAIMSVAETGALEVSTIQRIVSGVRQTLELTLADGQRLRLTPAHPVHTRGQWTKARSLKPGDVVTTVDGSATVRSVRRFAGRTRVYGLTVSPADNLFANGILVHNKKFIGVEPTAEALARNPWEGFSEGPDRLALRLEFTPDGKGRAAVMTFSSSPELWRITWVTFRGHRTSIRMVRERDGRVWMLRGWGITGDERDPRLLLCRNIRPVKFRDCRPHERSIVLHNPRNLSGRLRQLREALEPSTARAY